MEFQVPPTPVPFIIQISDTNEHTRHFKRPFGVEGEVSNGRPAKRGLLIAALSRAGVGVDLLLTSAPPTTPQLTAQRHD